LIRPAEAFISGAFSNGRQEKSKAKLIHPVDAYFSLVLQISTYGG
jgi:hypothetical protein